MSFYVHRLDGCRPTPLAHYLKALGVLRIVGEQADSSARGFWKEDVFHLVTKLDRDGLEAFFLEKYEPTPMIGPWNGGSGFYEGDAIEGREALRRSSAPRFAAYRQAIEDVLGWPELPATGLDVGSLCERVRGVAGERKGKGRETVLKLLGEIDAALSGAGDEERKLLFGLRIEELDMRGKDKSIPKGLSDRARRLSKAAKKVRSQFKSAERSGGKPALALAARRRLSSQAIRWLDAALLITGEGDLKFPPLLISGGNEGHLDYTNSFTTALLMTVVEPAPESLGWLRNSLWAMPSTAMNGPKTGQFNPGRAGGFNQGAGFNAEPGTNPWDNVLGLEGTIVWASSISRVGDAAGTSALSSPFTVRLKAVGYSSAEQVDETDARAEVWAPLWARPVGHAELGRFIAESRAQVDRRNPRRGLERRTVRNTVEFAEAASSLGVARGITEFGRFGIMKRRGDSYVALPAGRFTVSDRSEADLIRGLDGLLTEVDAFMRGFGEAGPPATLSSLRRRLDAAIFDALARPSKPALQAVLSSIGRLERFLAQRDRTKEPRLHQPLGGLNPRWLVAADDGAIELRIAASLASLQRCGKVGPLRANLTGVDPEKPWSWAKGRGQVAWSGPSLPKRLSGALRQRMMDAERLGCAKNPLHGSLEVAPADVAAFVAGEVDDLRIEDLLFGLALLDWRLDREDRVRREIQQLWRAPVRKMALPAQLALLKLVFWPGTLRIGPDVEKIVTPEPAILSLLLSGRVDDACNVARRRLFASGLSPVDIEWPREIGFDPIRLAAALLLPVGPLSTLTRSVLRLPATR